MIVDIILRMIIWYSRLYSLTWKIIFMDIYGMIKIDIRYMVKKLREDQRHQTKIKC